jgi:hypothetical protein
MTLPLEVEIEYEVEKQPKENAFFSYTGEEINIHHVWVQTDQGPRDVLASLSESEICLLEDEILENLP